MWILEILLIGLCAGLLAKMVVKGNNYGLVGNIVVGVVGALIGRYLFYQIGMEQSGLLGELLSATVGAIILLLILRFLPNRRS